MDPATSRLGPPTSFSARAATPVAPATAEILAPHPPGSGRSARQSPPDVPLALITAGKARLPDPLAQLVHRAQRRRIRNPHAFFPRHFHECRARINNRKTFRRTHRPFQQRTKIRPAPSSLRFTSYKRCRCCTAMSSPGITRSGLVAKIAARKRTHRRENAVAVALPHRAGFEHRMARRANRLHLKASLRQGHRQPGGRIPFICRGHQRRRLQLRLPPAQTASVHNILCPDRAEPRVPWFENRPARTRYGVKRQEVFRAV